MSVSKRIKQFREMVDPVRLYTFDEAIELLAQAKKTAFNQTVEVAVALGIAARQSDQQVRGSVVMPHGTGKSVRIAVFAQGDAAEQAKEAGADMVGMDDLAAQVKAGALDFDVVIATPDSMRVVGQLGPILGPRNLMPNPKVGTVTKDVKTAVSNAKSGQVQFRTEKNGLIHAPVGKADFKPEALKANIEALLAALKKAKPSAAKGVYLRRLSLSTTMGPGIKLDLASFEI